MRFEVSPKVFELLPDACFGVVAIKGADNTKPIAEVSAQLHESIAACEKALEGVKVKESPEIVPYREAFRTGWPGMVLVAHIHHRGMDERLPSSLSPAVIDGLLRRELGWDGVVISDDLQMGAVYKGRSLEERVRLAILAGNDILLFGNYLKPDPMLHEKVFQAVLDLVRSGEVSRERLEASWRRIETMKAKLAGGL